MAPTILSSPFLSIPIIDKLLANRSLPPIERIQLLHAKITLLTNDISAALHSTPSNPPSDAQVSSSSSSLRLQDERQSTIPTGPTSSLNPRSASRQNTEGTITELECRKEVSELYLSLSPPKFIEAESELSIVEAKCKSILKRHKDRAKKGLDVELDDGVLETVRKMRIDGLRLLVRVEEGLGREGRAKRWTELIETLQ